MSVDEVAGQIVRRYANPGRTAYLYLFRLKSDSNLTPLLPEVDSVQAAWIDEGSGLQPAVPAFALERCAVVHDSGLNHKQAQNSMERRQQMARVVQFIVTQPDESIVEVDLASRALLFSPKGDRIVHEQWRHSADGWYSAYQPDQDRPGQGGFLND